MRLRAHAAGSVLGRIVASKQEEVVRRQRDTPLSSLEQVLVKSDRSFFGALAGAATKPALIAEVKRRSPSKGELRANFSLPEILAAYSAHAHAISVVTDEPFFGGRLGLLREVRAQVTQPVMLKDFVISKYQITEARAFGADAVLLMSSVLETSFLADLLAETRALSMEALVEVHDRRELEEVLGTGASIVGINNRDLSTLSIDAEQVFRLAPLIPGDKLIVAESGVESREMVERLRGVAHAVLIGTAWMQAPDIDAKMRELGW